MTASAELDMAAEPQPPALSYPQLFLRFLRFGLMAWGGPVAQIAMLRKELVEEERWISSARFNRLLFVVEKTACTILSVQLTRARAAAAAHASLGSR